MAPSWRAHHSPFGHGVCHGDFLGECSVLRPRGNRVHELDHRLLNAVSYGMAWQCDSEHAANIGQIADAQAPTVRHDELPGDRQA